MLLASSGALWAARLPDSAGLSINAGMTGSWADPGIPGQGLFIDVDPSSNTVFLAWFTYTVDSGAGESIIAHSSNTWFVAVGNYEPGSSGVVLSLIRTDGGVFDQPVPVTETEIGILTLEFTGCESANMEFNFHDGNSGGTLSLIRLTSGEICESILSN